MDLQNLTEDQAIAIGKKGTEAVLRGLRDGFLLALACYGFYRLLKK